MQLLTQDIPEAILYSSQKSRKKNAQVENKPALYLDLQLEARLQERTVFQQAVWGKPPSNGCVTRVIGSGFFFIHNTHSILGCGSELNTTPWTLTSRGSRILSQIGYHMPPSVPWLENTKAERREFSKARRTGWTRWHFIILKWRSWAEI